MEGYHHHYHHHNTTASQNHKPLSSSMSNSHTGHLPSSSSSGGDVPMTASGPITISMVITLTLVICMILNCGKVKRKIGPYCSTQSLMDRAKPIKQPGLSSSTLSTSPPTSNYSDSLPWPTTPITTTLLYPKRPPPVVHQPQYARSYPYPIASHPLSPPVS